MPEDEREARIPVLEVIIEALKGIQSEILLYAIAMAALLVSSAYLGIDFLKELKRPLMALFSAGLVAYFFARAVPQARARLRRKKGRG